MIEMGVQRRNEEGGLLGLEGCSMHRYSLERRHRYDCKKEAKKKKKEEYGSFPSRGEVKSVLL